jgi:hypothetical protein
MYHAFSLIKYIILLMEIKKSRPSFEKLAIGPLLVLGEMTMLGHYMESLKIAKQATGSSYPKIAKQFWKIDGPMSLYRGFYPYGLLQMGKGIPVLFTQGEVKYQLDKHTDLSNTNKGIISGISAGISQAFIITPLQRLKTSALTDTASKGSNSSKLLFNVIKNEGVSGLFKGLQPMIMKRSIDWGLRFGVISRCNQYIINKNGPGYELTPFDKVCTGFIGGATSCITMPFDSWIANCQKHNQTNISTIQVAKNMYNEAGILAFTRGLTMRILHSGYHTAWMVGIGSIVFNKIS